MKLNGWLELVGKIIAGAGPTWAAVSLIAFHTQEWFDSEVAEVRASSAQQLEALAAAGMAQADVVTLKPLADSQAAFQSALTRYILILEHLVIGLAITMSGLALYLCSRLKRLEAALQGQLGTLRAGGPGASEVT